MAYVRRKQFEARLQALEIVRVLAQAFDGVGGIRQKQNRIPARVMLAQLGFNPKTGAGSVHGGATKEQ